MKTPMPLLSLFAAVATVSVGSLLSTGCFWESASESALSPKLPASGEAHSSSSTSAPDGDLEGDSPSVSSALDDLDTSKAHALSSSSALDGASAGSGAGGQYAPVSRGENLMGVVGNRSFFFYEKQTGTQVTERANAARERLKNAPRDRHALKALAYEAIAQGNAEGALTFMRLAQGSKAAQRDDEMCVIMGVAHLLRGEESKGLALFAEAEERNPRSILPAMNRGLLALSKGAGRDAAAHFARALEIEPDNLVAQLHLASAYSLAKDYKRAERSLLQVLKRKPNHAVALYNLGMVYHVGLRNFSKAKEQFRKIVDDKKQPAQMRLEAEGALANITREEHGKENLATIGVF